MGKNFSKGNSGKRKESDFYETHKSLTREFLGASAWMWDTRKTMCDPCAGGGAITDVLKEIGFPNVVGHDINTDGVDFLTDNTPIDYIVTNPPYTLANEFILHCKEVTTDKFAMLLPITYLQGSYRYNNIWMDSEYPLSDVFVFNRFPLLGVSLREDGKFPTGMTCYAFYVWSKTCDYEPIIHWIDVDKYVLKKGDV